MRILVTATLALLVSSANLAAQDPGDPDAGAAYASQVCAECHAVADEGPSPDLLAPTFKEIANRPGMTGTALVVWMQTEHPTMPNLVLEQDDLDNVVAYILTLKD
jgi:mono/diheme cytochrome c family protein